MNFKVKYFGSFSELPIGSVKARGWIEAWLGRQLQGLTGHPEKPVLEPPTPDLKQAPKNPADLPNPAEMHSPGEIETMTLVPYGATHLRLTTLPLIG